MEAFQKINKSVWIKKMSQNELINSLGKMHKDSGNFYI